MRTLTLGFACGALGATLATVAAHARSAPHEQYVSPWKTPWTYEGAAHWSELDPQYTPCNTGNAQSPIDLRNPEYADLPPLRFTWRSAPLKYIINNGHTIRVNYTPGNGDILNIGGKRYELTQFHFHHPSEEQIDGRAYPMEVHLMYQASDGHMAGVAVFIRSGRADRFVQRVWDHMPQNEGQEAFERVALSPASLLPANRVGRYSMYTGSVTAPPCTEGVRWFVLEDTVSLSPQQIEAFAKLYPNDARPLQPLNGRVVQRSR